MGAIVKTLFHRGRKGARWSASPALAPRAVEIPSFDGATLSGTWFACGSPRGAVLLAHPDRRYGQHWFVREGWVHLLRAHGYEALTFDFPGYGGSRGPPTYHHEHVLAAARVAHEHAGGLPLHAVGLSLGAFAIANAAPRLDAESLVLESPYPSFNAWYGRGAAKWAMDFFDGVFPRTSASIQADRNLARARARRILVALAEEDEVTAPRLTEAMVERLPPGRARLVRVPGARHLEPFAASAGYRAAILATLAPPKPG